MANDLTIDAGSGGVDAIAVARASIPSPVDATMTPGGAQAKQALARRATGLMASYPSRVHP